MRLVVACRRGNDYGVELASMWPHVSLGVSAHLSTRFGHVTLHTPVGYAVVGCIGLGESSFDESTCDRCGQANPVWWTHPSVWQAVYGTGGQPTRQGVLCPSCFIADAERAGVTAPQGTAGWVVAPSLAALGHDDCADLVIFHDERANKAEARADRYRAELAWWVRRRREADRA